MSRPLSQIQPDGVSTKTWLYGGQWTRATNELGNSWTRKSDAFGQLAAVFEPGITGATTYQYDGLGNLTSIQQPGNTGEMPRGVRSFVYDSMSRLVCASQPENSTASCPSAATATPPAGVWSYLYDADGNVTQRKDSRGVTTTYLYDALSRLKKKIYSDGSPNAVYYYDENGDWNFQGCSGSGPFTQCNTIGRLSSAYVADGYLAGNVLGYDAVGRLHLKASCTGPAQCGHDANAQWYFYDLAGQQQNQDHGNASNSGAFFGSHWMTYDSGGRLSTLGFFATPLPSPITPEFSANQYGPGGLVQSTLGNQLLAETRSYDSSLRTSGYVLGSASSPNLYGWSVGFQGNGNLATSSDAVNGSWTYTNDALNRLTAANSPSVSLTWSYDSFGNRWSQALTGGMGLSRYDTYAQTGTNRPDALLGAMDAAGQPTVDGSATPVALSYDAEGRLASAGAESYLYNALGERVAKFSNGTPYTGNLGSVYLYDGGGRVVTELDGSYNVRRRESYAGGLHIATYDASGNIVYPVSDWLGTPRAIFNSTGTLCQLMTSQPFGDNLQQQGGCGNSPVFFTGLERDTEANSDHTPNRQYSFSAGRWITPDPYGGSVDPANPQTLNRYAYVLNNPLSFVDPTGLYCAWEDGTSDDDPSDGGVDAANCRSGGGHWTDQSNPCHGIDGCVSTFDWNPPSLSPIIFSASTIGPVPNPDFAFSAPGDFPQPCLASKLQADKRIASAVGLVTDFSGALGVVGKVAFVYETMKTGAIWDFKNQPTTGAHPELDDFGNFHYGAIGRSVGLPDGFMKWAAGVASWNHYRSKGKTDPYGNPFSGAPYGDNPENQYWITKGQQNGSC